MNPDDLSDDDLAYGLEAPDDEYVEDVVDPLAEAKAEALRKFLFEKAEWEQRVRELAARKAEEALALQIIPDLEARFGIGAFGLAPLVLQSAVYAARPYRATQSARERVSVTLAAGYNSSIEYHGVRLTQAHLTLLGGLLLESRGFYVGQELGIKPRRFAREVLGWSYSNNSIEKVVCLMTDLCGSTISFTTFTKNGPRVVTAAMLDPDLTRPDGEWMKFGFMPGIVELFRETASRVSLKERAKLQEGVGTWMLGLVCSTDGGRLWTFEELRRLSGSSRSPDGFRRDALKALKQLREMALTEFEVKGDKIKLRPAHAARRRERMAARNAAAAQS